ncbi:EAL domain-containing protein [Oceanobacillus halophilus]|nr:EAL domain-containing protein [Oceanobacillus halophilus]
MKTKKSNILDIFKNRRNKQSKKEEKQKHGSFMSYRSSSNIQSEKALAKSEVHLNHAQQIASIGSWEYNIIEDKITCSENFYDIFGIEKTDDFSMNTPFSVVHPDDYDSTFQVVSDACNMGVDYATEFRIFHGKTKELRYISVQAESVMKDEKPYQLIGVVKDDTPYKLLENELQNTINNLKYVYDHLNVGIWMREYMEGEIVFASKGMEEILEYPIQKLYDEPDYWKNMVLPEDRKELQDSYQLLQSGQSIENRFRLKSGNGKEKWLYEHTIPWMDDNSEIKYLFGMVADISAEVEMREKLDYLAKFDELTNFPNQKSLFEKLNTLCKKEQPFAVLYLDLDRFHIINDSLGYHIGDDLLINIAKRLQAVVQDNGYIARMSSDDFVLILEKYPNNAHVFQLAEQLIRHINQAITINDFELKITASIGISFYPEDGDNKLSLIENAHSALFRAKRQGKNNYRLYSSHQDISSYKKYILEKDMRKAIVNEDFEIYYQPQVNKEGIIYGAEALLRWNHKEWGLVSPGEFIPLAEENHLINRIGDWVIRKVCAQLRDWKDKDLTIRPIAINLSPIRFMKTDLVAYVKRQLDLFDVPAKYLEFEITEGSLLKEEKTVISNIEKLRNLGVKIAIDDFGTGYSSLKYLRYFQVDTIKIDQAFIKDVNDGSNVNSAIVSSVLHLAREMGIKAVAEGVEEYEQFEFLKQKECDIIQGYLFSKPVPVNQLEKMMWAGYLKPSKVKQLKEREEERRRFYRLEFLFNVLGKMTITEVSNRQVNLGVTPILINNISIGGMKILSSLNLPVNTAIKFRFSFTLMNEYFELEGNLVWKEEAKGNTYFYGIEFNLDIRNEDRLAPIINKMSAFRNMNHEIPGTEVVQEDPFTYLQKHLF